MSAAAFVVGVILLNISAWVWNNDVTGFAGAALLGWALTKIGD